MPVLSDTMPPQDDLALYVVTKNASQFPTQEPFRAIQGGRALTSAIPNAIGDHTGDNISLMNEYYAEISSMYWVWKNAPRSKHVGFFHHRRFLNFGEPLAPQAHWSVRNFHDFSPETMKRFGWSTDVMLAQIGTCDLLVPHIEEISRPPRWDAVCTSYTHYRNCHVSRDIHLALDSLATVHPDDVELAEKCMASTSGYFCHMYIMKWELFQAYMDWLFRIFWGMGDEIDLSAPIYAPSTGQTRVYGFLGERLFSIYVEKCRRQGAAIKELERLFGIFPAEWTLDLKPRDKPQQPMITRFQKGVSLRAFGRQIDVLSPD